MKVLIDANVLYPTVMREIVLGIAAEGLFQPLWSARILEEWARATRKLGPDAEPQARAEIALLRDQWPRAEVAAAPDIEARLQLPDPDDLHVLAVAIASGAEIILTLNAVDFPTRVLAAEGIARKSPDELLQRMAESDRDPVARVVTRVHAEAERLSGQTLPLRALLKKARLPRLGKALTRQDNPA